MTAVERSDDHPPVTDWATDFDHTDEAWAADPFPIWDELRSRTARSPTPSATAACGCRPATRTSPPSPTTPSASRPAASCVSRSARRSSWRRRASPRRSRPTRRSTTTPAGCCCPPSRPRPSTSSSRRPAPYCEELIDAMGDRDVVDAAEEYAQHIPVRVIANMLGFPEEDADRFRGFVNHVLEGVALPIEQRAEGMMVLFDYLQRAGRGPRRQPPRRPHHLPARRRDGRRAARARPRRRHASPCCSSPASTPPGAPSARRSGTSPPPGRPRAPRRRARAAARPRWRSCCGPTPRSPWPAS